MDHIFKVHQLWANNKSIRFWAPYPQNDPGIKKFSIVHYSQAIWLRAIKFCDIAYERVEGF